MNKNSSTNSADVSGKVNALAGDIMKYINEKSKVKINSAKQVTLDHYAQYLIYTKTKYKNGLFSKRLLNRMPSMDISFTALSSKICSLDQGSDGPASSLVINSEKLNYFFWVTISSQKMLVGKYFSKYTYKSFKKTKEDEDKIFACFKTKYFDISSESLSCSQIEYDWREKMAQRKHPAIEYDRNGLFDADKLIQSLWRAATIKNSCYTTGLEIQSKTYLSKIEIKNAWQYEQNEPSDFKRSAINTQVLQNTSYTPFRSEITDIINDNHWKMILSRQEKFLVESQTPFIISGRPGTGKTTVILFKIFSQFFNLQFEKSIQKNKEIDWRYITSNLALNELRDQFRVVFTSLSQDLCDKVQEMYSTMLLQENIDLGYKPIQRKELSAIDSFRDVKAYPLFVSFRKIMFMIDGSLTHQFFARTNLRRFEQANPDCQVNYKRDMKFMCNNYQGNNNEDEIKVENYFYRSPELDEKNRTVNKTECGIEEFTQFYNDLMKKANEFKVQPKAKSNDDISFKTRILYRVLPSIKKLHLTPAEIYAQIYSVIKGSLFSYLSPLNAITREEYNKKGKKLTDFEEENEHGFNERDLIYDIFMLYENYKRKYSLFDMQDFVNHLIRQVKIEFKNMTIIDYMFIDEIQDLTMNQIYLLVILSKYPIVFAGDTCQTISESNRFRFKDLKTLFYFFAKNIPDYPHVEGALLNINYRLNASLLKLTTFFANIIKLMFPNTVDKFNDDYSVKITPFLPSQLDSMDTVIRIIEGKGEDNFQGQNFTFSYYHCFICRNAEEAKQLALKHNEVIFTLDVQRCKGLEFEIVIVYNFFSSSKFKELWKDVFKHLTVIPAENSVQNLSQVLRKENLSFIIENIKKLFPDLDKADDQAVISTIVDCHKDFLSAKINMDFNKHSMFEFCAELKQFYVIITRAQTFMLFYEEDPECEFIAFTTKHKLISADCQTLVEQMKGYFNQKEMSIADKETMIALAEKEFKAYNYSKAAYLYKIVHLKEKAIEAEVYALNEELRRIDVNQKEYFLTQNQEILNKISKIKACFNDPMGIEGQALSNLGRYPEAIEAYDKNKLFDKSGYIYLYCLKDYLKAFEVYNSLGNFKLCIIALESGNMYRRLYNYLSDVNEDIGVVEYSSTYRKYANQYLRSFQLKSCKLKDIELSSFVNKANESTLTRFSNIKGSLNETISEFFSNYSNMLIKLAARKNKNDSTTSPSPANSLGYETEKDKKTVNDLMKDFAFDQDIQRMIDTFFKKDEDSIILSIIELIPEIVYLRSDGFNAKEYYQLSLGATEGKKAHIAKLYTRIKNGIEAICEQAKLDEKSKEKCIKDISMYTCCFKSSNYAPEHQTVLSSLLLEEKIMKNSTMKNEVDLTKAIHLSALFRLFICHLLSEKEVTSEVLHMHIEKLKLSLFDFNLLFEETLEKFKEILDSFLIQCSCDKIIVSFDVFAQRFFSRKLKYSFTEYCELMTLIASISIFVYLLGDSHSGSFKFNSSTDISSLINLSKRAHLFCEKVLKYSKSTSLSNILLFTLFSPFGISDLPKITTITPLNLYQQINMCLLNQNAPLFTSLSPHKGYIIDKKIKGVFDAKGTNFILKKKTAYKLYKKYHQGAIQNILTNVIQLIEKEPYANITNNIATVSSALPWLYSLSSLNPNDKPYRRLNSALILQLFEESIYYPPNEREEQPKEKHKTPSIIFHSLLYTLFLNREDSELCIQSTSTLVFYLSYQMKAKLNSETDTYDSKLNLYLLLMMLYDSYGITYNKIEGLFIFEDDNMENLLFYDNPLLWMEILSLLNTIDYSPMIALIWLKKISYQLIAWIQKMLCQEKTVVYDIAESLTTNEMSNDILKNKSKLNSSIGEYFKALSYFIKNFILNRHYANEFEVQFYEMIVHCLFLSFLALIKKCSSKREGIDTVPIEDFIAKYKKESRYYTSLKVTDDKALLETPTFDFNTQGGKCEVKIVMRNIKDLFTKLPQKSQVTEFTIRHCNHSKSLWNQPFELSKSEANKFLLNRFNNENTYGEALLNMKKRFGINTNAAPKVLNDECLFKKEGIDNEFYDEEDDDNEEDGGSQIRKDFNYYLDEEDDAMKSDKKNKKQPKKKKVIEEMDEYEDFDEDSLIRRHPHHYAW